MQIKKILSTVATVFAAAALFTGCNGDNAGNDTKHLKIGASPTPHAEILEQVKPTLKNEGIELEIIEFNDYVQPNIALNDKELDANFFQHIQYLNDFIKEHNMKLANAGGVHIEPIGIYSKKYKSLNDLPEGAQITIPNDPTNGGRALELIAKAGLIKIKENLDHSATIQDIAENPKNFKFVEAEAAQLPRTLEDVDAAVINTNYAIQINLTPTKDALFSEDKNSPYVNVIAVREGDETRPEIQSLVKALQSSKIKQFIEEKYKGEVVPAF